MSSWLWPWLSRAELQRRGEPRCLPGSGPGDCQHLRADERRELGLPLAGFGFRCAGLLIGLVGCSAYVLFFVLAAFLCTWERGQPGHAGGGLPLALHLAAQPPSAVLLGCGCDSNTPRSLVFEARQFSAGSSISLGLVSRSARPWAGWGLASFGPAKGPSSLQRPGPFGIQGGPGPGDFCEVARLADEEEPGQVGTMEATPAPRGTCRVTWRTSPGLRGLYVPSDQRVVVCLCLRSDGVRRPPWKPV